MPDILHRIAAKSTTEKLYAASVTPEGGAAWWTTETSGSGEIGGVVHFQFGDKGFFDMKTLEREEGRLVVWEVIDGPAEWIGTKVRWELRQEGEYAILLFRHEGWKEAIEFMQHCSTKWGVFLLSLKALVESGVGQPFPNDVKIDDWN